MSWDILQLQLKADIKSLARCISLVENEVEGYQSFMQTLEVPAIPVVGITGPPGAGKSTLTDALITAITAEGKKVAVLCVDPSSPFNLGALLGDRIRMSQWYNHPQVFIRSLATRGSLGGLHPKILEITDLCKAAGYDYVVVETVGVGQSEIEITGLADVTLVVLVPEAGDEVQTMKAGLMEIADIFVVNKADRPDAQLFVKHLRSMLAPAFHRKQEEIPIVQTVAAQNKGVIELWNVIQQYLSSGKYNAQKSRLLAEKVYYLIEQARMRDVDKNTLQAQIEIKMKEKDFNIYKLAARMTSLLPLKNQ
ncbi:MAG: methylmalonyl Co-A mutase-associated GTPase MeaB [Bacteroidetes bacterium]|nr:methylmalonyl Co-A mutase-associated GTPase MeaB [Bacteroidota bacterium]